MIQTECKLNFNDIQFGRAVMVNTIVRLVTVSKIGLQKFKTIINTAEIKDEHN